VRWIIGDTESGDRSGEAHPHSGEAHTLQAPHQSRDQYGSADLSPELNSGEKTYMASVSWAYPEAQLSALRERNSATEAALPLATGVDINALNFRYRIEGDAAAWKPLRAFDDGRQVFIAFPVGISEGELPPTLGHRTGRRWSTRQLSRQGQLHDCRSAVRGGGAETWRQRAADRSNRSNGWKNQVMSDDFREEEDRRQSTRSVEEIRRPQRQPVTRLSRKVLIGFGAVAATGLGGALLIALDPPRQMPVTELLRTSNPNPPDGVANLPRDYAALPRPVAPLGPPVPGDLDKPILDTPATVPNAPQASPEQQRRTQEQEAARTSPLFAAVKAPSPIAASPVSPQPIAPVSMQSDRAPQDHKLAFLEGNVDRHTLSGDRLQPPPSPYILQAGAVISASLITGLRSDLPGQVTAQVSENVYDSPTGKILLIPQGARLIGAYDAQAAFGQSRALLVWNRLVLPNGKSIVLERQPGADAQGYAGVEDQVDNHWGALFKAAILSTILSVGAEAGTTNSENDLTQAIRRGASQSINQAGEQIVGRSLNIPPTITVRPGFPVLLLVSRDLILEPYSG